MHLENEFTENGVYGTCIIFIQTNVDTLECFGGKYLNDISMTIQV